MPTVHVSVPGLLARFTRGERRIAVEAATVRGAVRGLVERHPALQSHVFDGGGELRPHLQLFHENRQVGWDAAGDAALAESDEVVLFQAVSGG